MPNFNIENINNLRQRMTNINSEVTKVTNARNQAIGVTTSLTSQLNELFAEYQKNYGVTLAPNTLQNEIDTVCTEAANEVNLMESIIRLINNGDYNGATQLLEESKKPVDVMETVNGILDIVARKDEESTLLKDESQIPGQSYITDFVPQTEKLGVISEPTLNASALTNPTIHATSSSTATEKVKEYVESKPVTTSSAQRQQYVPQEDDDDDFPEPENNKSSGILDGFQQSQVAPTQAKKQTGFETTGYTLEDPLNFSNLGLTNGKPLNFNN